MTLNFWGGLHGGKTWRALREENERLRIDLQDAREARDAYNDLLRAIDQMLARRTALDACPGRLDKITLLLKVANFVDPKGEVALAMSEDFQRKEARPQ